MNHSIGVERTYNLGDYKSLRVSDYINDIPEELMLNADFMDSLRVLQMMRCDKVFFTYQKESQTYKNASKEFSIEDALRTIDEVSVSRMEGLKKVMASVDEEKEE